MVDCWDRRGIKDFKVVTIALLCIRVRHTTLFLFFFKPIPTNCLFLTYWMYINWYFHHMRHRTLQLSNSARSIKTIYAFFFFSRILILSAFIFNAISKDTECVHRGFHETHISRSKSNLLTCSLNFSMWYHEQMHKEKGEVNTLYLHNLWYSGLDKIIKDMLIRSKWSGK